MPKPRRKSRTSTPRTTTATPSATTTSQRLTPVRIRMFRQGLGDCFLLTFDPGAKERHILIDCGSLGAATTGISLGTVAELIGQTTSRHLDLVVATHEHWDHVAAFGSEREAFAGMKVDNVWLAWTENPNDDDAKALEKYRHDLGEALAATRAALTAGAAAGHERCAEAARTVTDIAGFNGPDALGVGTKSGLSENLDAAMQFVRTKLVPKPEYQTPGTVAEPAWLPGFRIYFLGPPRDPAKLRELEGDDYVGAAPPPSPSGPAANGAGTPPSRPGRPAYAAVYGITSGLKVGAALQAGQDPKSLGLPVDEIEAEMPFEGRFRWPLKSEHALECYPDYFAEIESWRRVDGDWLNAAADAGEQLALQLDSITNNTSLAFAIERIADGKVLLFPADAQEGNWVSWQGLKWTVREASGATKVVTVRELLDAAVFYKVGHHGSHNGTAKGKGLELMKTGALTAFIPVDRKVALGRNPKDSWQMPARPLYRALLEKCEGRVVRSDLGWAAAPAGAKFPDVEKEFVGLATAAEWSGWAKSQASATAAKTVTITPQYVDFLLPA